MSGVSCNLQSTTIGVSSESAGQHTHTNSCKRRLTSSRALMTHIGENGEETHVSVCVVSNVANRRVSYCHEVYSAGIVIYCVNNVVEPDVVLGAVLCRRLSAAGGTVLKLARSL